MRHWTVPSVTEASHAFLAGAMDTAEDVSVVLYAMPDDAAVAMRASGCKSLNSTFETVEHHGASAHRDLKALVVVVTALVAPSH